MISPDTPLVSIIVPVYNVEDFINRCLDSIFSQTLKNFECIIIDDGSGDKSIDICNLYVQKDKRFHVIQQENSGVSAARNRGITAAIGEYIMFADSDDYLLPDMMQKLYDAINIHKNDVICCGFLHDKNTYSTNTKEYSGSQAKMAFFLEDAGLLGTAWNKLYKSSIIKKNNILFPSGYSFGEDFLFNLTYFSFIHIALCIEDVLYIYNINEQSISKNRPNLDQSLFRFRNINRQILQLNEYNCEQFHNRILALDFTYTVFLIRNLYIPSILQKCKRFKLLYEIKYFYRVNPALYSFRSFKYRFFYLFFINTPLVIFDIICCFLFSLIYLKRKYV
jgi:glycosyltransferase involved in cell wall biosynthesis